MLKGPGSVLYGSDAIGGTVNAVTLSPYSYGPGEYQVNGRTHYRVSSGENSHVGRAEVSLGLGETTGFLLGGTAQHFGDVIGGGEVGRQGLTGYDSFAYDLKTEHFIDSDTRLIFAHQRFRMNNAPRTHRTLSAVPFEGSSVGSDRRRDFDQDRELTYLRLLAGDVGSVVADTVEATISYQRQSETQDRVRGSGAQSLDGFDVDTLGLSLQAGVDSPIGMLTYGLEFYHDEVNSFSTSNAIQGPVGDDASYDLLGLYAQTEIDLAPRWQLILGGRFTYAAADADSVLDPVSSGRISVEDDWSDVVGSVQIIHQLVEDELNVFAGVSQGFRTPNLSDLTRFDSARSNEFEIPSPGLEPERYVNFEVGTKLRQENLSVEMSYFYTLVRDQILRFPTGDTIGSDSVVTKDNVGDGRVWGLELGAAWRFAPEWTLFGNVAYLEGEVSNFPSATGPLVDEYFSKMMPLTGQVGLRWDAANLPVFLETRVAMADRADKLSSADLNDTSRIPPGGTPGYAVWSVGGGWRVCENVMMHVTLDNLLDEDYRVHGSGQNQPGRQAIFSVTMSF